MKAHSHRVFGDYLLRSLAPELPRQYRTAFLWGCVEPDYNYATYLRGFVHHEKLRGHNYPNAERCINRLCEHLQLREVKSLLSWYRMGKLVHYTADAFTHAHNVRFGGNLREHRSYEMALQEAFLPALDVQALATQCGCGGVMEMIRAEHEHYLAQPVGPETDVKFVLRASLTAFASLSMLPLAQLA